MPEAAADLPAFPCYFLFSESEIQGNQWLGPDLFFSRARVRARRGSAAGQFLAQAQLVDLGRPASRITPPKAGSLGATWNAASHRLLPGPPRPSDQGLDARGLRPLDTNPLR
jgi:hypothetical protein